MTYRRDFSNGQGVTDIVRLLPLLLVFKIVGLIENSYLIYNF
jgi:hypothetical protein